MLKEKKMSYFNLKGEEKRFLDAMVKEDEIILGRTRNNNIIVRFHKSCGKITTNWPGPGEKLLPVDTEFEYALLDGIESPWDLYAIYMSYLDCASSITSVNLASEKYLENWTKTDQEQLRSLAERWADKTWEELKHYIISEFSGRAFPGVKALEELALLTETEPALSCILYHNLRDVNRPAAYKIENLLHAAEWFNKGSGHYNHLTKLLYDIVNKDSEEESQLWWKCFCDKASDIAPIKAIPEELCDTWNDWVRNTGLPKELGMDLTLLNNLLQNGSKDGSGLEQKPEKKLFRITFQSEIYVKADSAGEAEQEFSEIPLFTKEAYEHAADFVEYISIDEQKEEECSTKQ